MHGIHPTLAMSEPSVTWVAKEGNYRAKLENGGFGTTEAGIAGRGTVLGPSRPAMPELLAGVRWNHRGRKRWKARGFGTTMAGDVGIASRGMVLGSPSPELLARERFWEHRGRRCRNC